MNLRFLDKIVQPFIPFLTFAGTWYFFFGKYFIPDLIYGMIFSWAVLKFAVVMTVVGYGIIAFCGIRIAMEQNRLMEGL